MTHPTLPINKNDVRYDPETQEITLKRERFDQLLNFIRQTVEKLEAAEDARDIAEYRAKRAAASQTVFQTILDDLEAGSKKISKWADTHSIKQLSERSGIPYATCHRIVTERLAKQNVHMADFVRLVEAAESTEAMGPKKLAVDRVLIGASAGSLQTFDEKAPELANIEIVKVDSG